eukprot:scaffold292605_cov28-Tisochrysis_lutea.AAC.1
MDRIYTPGSRSTIAWQKIGPAPRPLHGKGLFRQPFPDRDVRLIRPQPQPAKVNADTPDHTSWATPGATPRKLSPLTHTHTYFCFQKTAEEQSAACRLQQTIAPGLHSASTTARD